MQETFIKIKSLDMDARGVGHLENEDGSPGKVIFVEGALPGETVSFTPRLSRAIFVTSDSVYLDIAGFPAEGSAQIAVIVDGVQVMSGSVDLAGERPTTLPLTTPVGPNPAAVTLQVTAPTTGFLSVGLSELRPSQIPEEAWFARDQAAMSAEVGEP